MTPLCRFGFVAYDTEDDAAEAIRKLDGTDWNGRRLLVGAAYRAAASPLLHAGAAVPAQFLRATVRKTDGSRPCC